MSKEPLYSVVASSVEGWIRDGEWSAGAKLPPERSLCQRLGVSRVTLRQALAELERRGLVSRHQGRGTFVAVRRVETDASAFFSLSRAIRARGLRLVTRVLEAEQVEASRQLAHELGCLPGDRLLRLKRLRLVEDEPLILESSHLPVDRFPGLNKADLTERSLYDVLHDDYGCAPTEATETLEPIIVTREESVLMGVPPGVAT